MKQLEKEATHPLRHARHCGLREDLVQRAASADCPLLLTGETGTGKGHLARWIHEHSARAANPFVPVNCGALPESLIDSHLFGHARGSFSGAAADHAGLIRAAHGGTVLLDEVGELPHNAQLRLLRLIEEREVQPVGYSMPVRINVRIIAATNRSLTDLVRQGTFREDLYYRLDVVHLHLAPLRERLDEVPDLLDAFNAEFAAMYRQDALRFDRAAMNWLMRYRWPGNIRELRSLVERLHVLCGAHAMTIGVNELQQIGRLRPEPIDLPEPAAPAPFQRLRWHAANQTLEHCRGNVSRAAAALGVHRSTVYRWLEEQAVTA